MTTRIITKNLLQSWLKEILKFTQNMKKIQKRRISKQLTFRNTSQSCSERHCEHSESSDTTSWNWINHLPIDLKFSSVIRIPFNADSFLLTSWLISFDVDLHLAFRRSFSLCWRLSVPSNLSMKASHKQSNSLRVACRIKYRNFIYFSIDSVQISVKLKHQ